MLPHTIKTQPSKIFKVYITAPVQTIDSLNDVKTSGKEMSVISAGVGQTRNASRTFCYLHLQSGKETTLVEMIFSY